MEFDLSQLRELLTILNSTDIEELNLKSDDFELTLRKEQALNASAPNIITQEILPTALSTPQAVTNVEAIAAPSEVPAAPPISPFSI